MHGMRRRSYDRSENAQMDYPELPNSPDARAATPSLVETLESRLLLSASPVHSVAAHRARASTATSSLLNIVGSYAGTLTLNRPVSSGVVSSAAGAINDNSFAFSSNFASMGFGFSGFNASSTFVNDAFVAALPSAGLGGSGFLFNGQASPQSGVSARRVPMTLTINSESRSGLLTGEVSAGAVGLFNFTGVITRRRVTLVFSDGTGFISAKVSANRLVLSGKFADDTFVDTTTGSLRLTRTSG